MITPGVKNCSQGLLTLSSEYCLNKYLYIVYTILISGPEKSLAQKEIILQLIEIKSGKRPVSPYTM